MTQTTTATNTTTAGDSALSAAVKSLDGTQIAYTRVGAGDALILVDGALCDRESGPNASLAAALASDFIVFVYDRRGRGASGDTPPYAIQREVEDLEALIDAAGGSAYVYGVSSGGALALEATKRLGSIRRLALYELPFVVDDSRRPIPADWVAHLTELVRAERRAEAVRYFMRDCIGLPRVLVALMRFMPAWRKLKALAHTLPYDARIVGDAGQGKPLPASRWARVSVPTLVAAGGKSPVSMQQAMCSLAEVLPNAEHRTLEGQTHLVKSGALAPVLSEFFAD